MSVKGEKMGITFQAILNKITTTVDGGWRVSFDVSASDSEAMLELAKLRDTTLQIGIIGEVHDESGN